MKEVNRKSKRKKNSEGANERGKLNGNNDIIRSVNERKRMETRKGQGKGGGSGAVRDNNSLKHASESEERN